MNDSKESGARHRFSFGFTIIEIVISLLIVAVLAAIAFPSYSAFKRRAEKARCLSNMKVIHTGFDSFLLDNNHWPQMPPEALQWDESQYFGWWIKILQPYGVGQETWICASDKKTKERPTGETEYASSYIPAHFNEHQFTPYRWNQPWLAERGDFHGKGAHVMMPDGSVTNSTNPYGGK